LSRRADYILVSILKSLGQVRAPLWQNQDKSRIEIYRKRLLLSGWKGNSISVGVINISNRQPREWNRDFRQFRPIFQHKLTHQIQSVQQSTASPYLAIPYIPFINPIRTGVLFLEFRNHEPWCRSRLAHQNACQLRGHETAADGQKSS
jgi:hypothetical protein